MKKLMVPVVIIILIVGFIFWRTGPASAPKHTSTNSSQSEKITSQKAPVATSFNKKQYSLTDPTSLWVVVNKRRPLNPVSYAPPDLVSVGNGQQMRAAAASELATLISDASKQGFSLYAASGYRSYDAQVAAYTSIEKAYGQAYADSESARPGFSEHQTGWAVDLGTGNCSLNDCFASAPAGEWVAVNAYKYGFILRYPKGLEDITGYIFEPWHFRYVGVALATEMRKTDTKTLEQFFGLPAAPNYQQ